MAKCRVGVIFGSRSVEHEVSVITAQQVMAAFDRSKYEVIPIYLTKRGEWLSGEKLADFRAFKAFNPADHERVFIAPDPTVRSLVRAPQSIGRVRKLFGTEKTIELDVVFPAFHGTFGEDGTVQGLLELADIPYVGAGVVGSAVGMDKIIMKAVFREAGLPVVNYVWFSRRKWQEQPEETVHTIETNLNYPLFVKPANLGSSVGITKVQSREDLYFALDVASHYDRRLLVEESVEGAEGRAMEINCSVLGNEDPIPSVCEQPVSWEEFLSYEDKYMRGEKAEGMKGAARRIPAPISEELTAQVQDMAVAAFKALDCRGVARVDFFLRKEDEKLFIGEINSLPGSISFYLWEPLGISPSQLVDRLVELAFDAHQEKHKTTYSYESNLLEQMGDIRLK
jgi:D-alanine-D-alanine ligase